MAELKSFVIDRVSAEPGETVGYEVVVAKTGLLGDWYLVEGFIDGRLIFREEGTMVLDDENVVKGTFDAPEEPGDYEVCASLYDNREEYSEGKPREVKCRELRVGGDGEALSQIVVSGSPEGATIYVDGVGRGVYHGVELVVDVEPGWHTVLAVKDGYWPFVYDVHVRRGEVEHVVYELRPYGGGGGVGLGTLLSASIIGGAALAFLAATRRGKIGPPPRVLAERAEMAREELFGRARRIYEVAGGAREQLFGRARRIYEGVRGE